MTKYEVVRTQRVPSENSFPFRMNEVKKEILPHIEGLGCTRCQSIVSFSQGPNCPNCGEEMREEIIVDL